VSAFALATAMLAPSRPPAVLGDAVAGPGARV
jgi:hypothetical protein